MAPKEKAIELVSKFREINEDYIDSYQSIQCALIAVDEILNNVEFLVENDYAYWYKVKQEIEKL